MNSSSYTLAHRIAEGRVPVSEGLEIAMLLAEQLRQLHEGGSSHGWLSPATVAITDSGLQLLPPDGALDDESYRAPELWQGGLADARSDIFSFGGIVYEILTGRHPFDGAETVAGPLQSGSAAVDRLVNGCTAGSPDSRYEAMSKVILELRVLLSAAKRSNAGGSAYLAAPAVTAPPQVSARPMAQAEPVAPADTPSTEAPATGSMHEWEARISARLQEQERTIANVANVANEVLKALREQQAAAAPVAMPAPTTALRPYNRQPAYSALDEMPPSPSSSGRMDKMLDLLSDKLSRLDLVISSAVDRIQKMEDIFDQFDTDAAALRDSVTRDIRNFERSLKSQGAAIESARTAMGQTDDLVERVVEAIDSLQAMFVTSAEERSLAS
jgi:serine/threonine protein kinase